MTFLPLNEKAEEGDMEISPVDAFRKTEFYKALVKHSGSGSRRLVQSMLSGSNLMEADEEMQGDDSDSRYQDALEAVGSPAALDILTKLVSAGFDRSILDIQMQDKKGESLTLILTDKAKKFTESLRDILSSCCEIEESHEENGMILYQCSMKEDHEPGQHAQEMAQDLPVK